MKILKITSCSMCPYSYVSDIYDDTLYCERLAGKENKSENIPKWCPLPDAPNQPLQKDAERRRI